MAEVAAGCREQTERYLRGEPSHDMHCLELFRRAVVERDNTAWAAVYSQYAGLMRRWVGTKMDPDEGLPAAFERFWRAINGEKFARFTSLAGVLNYLKMCVHTTAIDHARAQRATENRQSLDAIAAAAAPDDVEAQVIENVDTRAFWRRIQSTLDDERATRVLYLSYAIGLTPREIHANHPQDFSDVGNVYQIKRNALDRLRRSSALRG